ncbi:MAG TPA: 3,4-dihydroxy-2-butanone-4-phosphate synthase [Vitreimonas sp.]|uniref:3,4-dihydroxy-2-butanone-4-phosphate synthase n=1 Tax=Vitreimonas sp. TaxID=3069702 RepID=UPI002D5AB8DA|nr:3,4-dihydroxy-2-butanone-4-phosphate synthase [Vitreimonas sp.]HYD85934.1 3,4-dihydroxy-2-butanone-4-phosphate synthase [Vitreimonas sp.]
MAAKPSPIAELKRAISPIPEIIEEAREGRMFILVDAEDRENEGDLIIPAQFATPAAVNFMAKHGRGLICLALTAERTRALGLEPMAPRNQARLGTAFTVSIEAKEGISTGISAADRALTIATAIDASKGANDIVSPGHVFPLMARDGGVLVRAGHTEASVDIARAAGLNASAVICEIMNDDGTMARLPELVAFAQFHNLKIGAIDELIAYRRANDRFIEKLHESAFETRVGEGFRLAVFRNRLDGVEHAALVKGEISATTPTLVRVHRIDFAADVMGGYGARAGMIDKALAEIEAEGAGVLVLLRDLVPDALSRRLKGEPPEQEADDELRVIGIGSQILRELGVTRMIALSDNPQKLVGLEGYGLSIDGWRGFKS